MFGPAWRAFPIKIAKFPAKTRQTRAQHRREFVGSMYWWTGSKPALGFSGQYTWHKPVPHAGARWTPLCRPRPGRGPFSQLQVRKVAICAASLQIDSEGPCPVPGPRSRALRGQAGATAGIGRRALRGGWPLLAPAFRWLGGKRCTRMRPEVAPARSTCDFRGRFPSHRSHGIFRNLEGCAVPRRSVRA